MNNTIKYDTHTQFVKFASKAITRPWIGHLFIFCSCLKILKKSFPQNSHLYFVTELNKNTSKQYHSEVEMAVVETGQYII